MARTKRAAKNVRRNERPAPHDALFHRTFSVPRHAAPELQNVLPQELVRRIHWNTLRKASDKFVDTKLTNRYSDVLFEVEIDDESAFIYVLLEHKSAPEQWTLLQLLEYMVRIWRTYLRECEVNPSRLPLILPVVLHHGESGWTAPRRFIEYFGAVHDSVRPYVPDFGIWLDDIAKVGPDNLLVRPITAEAKLVLLTLLLGRKPKRFFQELWKWVAPLEETWRGHDKGLVFVAMIEYLNIVAHVPEMETRMALQKVLNFSPGERILYIEEVLHHRGRVEGLREGKVEGLREGKIEEAQELVSKLLTQRFGPLSPDTKARVESATKDELEEMALRVLSATTLDEVLGKPKRRRK